ncbi:MAG TPA: porin [Opitutales bacterium]|jgi:hypothetical protein|nr:porin [Opitutales bacterium]
MNYHSLKMLSLLAGAAVLGNLSVQAQDKATLDLLVKKNVITQDEANALAKSSGDPAVVAGPKVSDVKGLKIEGMVQAQYDGLTSHDNNPTAGVSNPPASNEFLLRRVYLGAIADLGNGWGGEVLMDFAGTTGANEPAGGPGAAAPAGAGVTNQAIGQNLFEKVIITKKLDDWNALLTLGYRKVDFTQEEMTSSSNLKVVERSVVSRYFDESYGTDDSRRLGFANRHTGIYFNGTLPSVLDGFYYSAAVTDGSQNSNIQYTNAGGYDKFAGWAALGEKNTIGDVKYDVGINFGYTGDQNSLNGPNQDNSEWGYNPYVRLDVGNFELAAEFEQVTVDEGKLIAPGAVTNANTATAMPYGYQATLSYKFNDNWEIVGRYAYLDTNGRGTNISDVARDADNTTDGGGSTNFYNDVDSFYAGVNYYFIGTSVKLSVGYEYDQFKDRQVGALGTAFNAGSTNVQGLRAQLQLQF